MFSAGYFKKFPARSFLELEERRWFSYIFFNCLHSLASVFFQSQSVCYTIKASKEAKQFLAGGFFIFFFLFIINNNGSFVHLRDYVVYLFFSFMVLSTSRQILLPSWLHFNLFFFSRAGNKFLNECCTFLAIGLEKYQQQELQKSSCGMMAH